MAANVIDVLVLDKRLASVAEEMGIVLGRTAFSPNIKERRDYSCAVFDGRGRLLAQASHIPVHLGSMPATLAQVLAVCPPGPGDTVITNDPFGGGSHLPDITLVRGVFLGEQPLFYLVNRAHHADVGGRHPGSMGMTRSIHEEGVCIPPTHLVRRGQRNDRFLQSFLGRVRNPHERLADLQAQEAALERGAGRLWEIHRRTPGIAALTDGLIAYGERLMRQAVAAIPDGRYTFADVLDDDGAGNRDLTIAVTITIRGHEATVDFSGTTRQTAGPVNAVRSVTVSATVYVFQCLLGLLLDPQLADEAPINHGSYLPLTIRTRPGTLVDARPPAPVAGGNVETSQRIVDVLLGGLAQALPERIPAAACGSMTNIAVGGHGAGTGEFTYYETIGGGMGGGPAGPGVSGIHCHMTNTMNTPVEALEHAYPMRITRYRLRRGSGGQGRHPGGDGLERGYLFLSPATVSLLADRQRRSPYGLAGGAPGRPGEAWLRRKTSNPASKAKSKKIPGKTSLEVHPGDEVLLKTPGGGGWGRGTQTP